MPSAPKANVPNGSLPVGESVLSSITRSEFSRNTENTRDILPTARILLRMTVLRSSVSLVDVGSSNDNRCSSSASSSLLQILRIASSISVTRQHQSISILVIQQPSTPPYLLFSPTKGKLQVNTSMKLGSQYGCGVQLNCRIFMTLFSYLSTAALLLYTSK